MDLVTFTEEILNGKVQFFCSVCNSDENVKWAFSSKNITYFGIQDIVNESSIIAFDDNIDGKVKSILQSKGDANYWIWKGDTIRSRENSMYVLTDQNTGNNR